MGNKPPKIQLLTFDRDKRKCLNLKSQFVRLIHENPIIEKEGKMVYWKVAVLDQQNGWFETSQLQWRTMTEHEL